MTMNRKIFSLMAAPIIIALSICACPVMVRAGDDVADLAPLLQTEKDAYLEARDALLKERREPWDVNAASNVSWELGLAAFILNERLAAPDAFEQWDKIHPILHASGVWYNHRRTYGGPEYLDAFVAFLLEKMWKGIPDEQERQYGYETLILQYGGKVARAGDTALWLALWEQPEDERFRFAAIYFACSRSDPASQPIIADLLALEDDKVAGYSAKGRCLDGLKYRDTEGTASAVLESWDHLTRNIAWMSKALGVLALNSSTRARQFVHQFALDAEQSEMLRSDVVAALCLRPHPDDVDVIRQFLAGPGSVNMKSGALQALHNCPLEILRPVVREILLQSHDPKMISSAIQALTRAYILAQEVDDALRNQDIAMLESVQRRENLDGAIRGYAGICIERLRGNRRVLLPDRPPDN